MASVAKPITIIKAPTTVLATPMCAITRTRPTNDIAIASRIHRGAVRPPRNLTSLVMYAIPLSGLQHPWLGPSDAAEVRRAEKCNSSRHYNARYINRRCDGCGHGRCYGAVGKTLLDAFVDRGRI